MRRREKWGYASTPMPEEPNKFTFEVLKNEYGIRAVRGPRGIPEKLKMELEK